jgi:hypothetical protein
MVLINCAVEELRLAATAVLKPAMFVLVDASPSCAFVRLVAIPLAVVLVETIRAFAVLTFEFNVVSLSKNCEEIVAVAVETAATPVELAVCAEVSGTWDEVRAKEKVGEE